jgi:shikimate dehydrogenase
MQFWVIAVIDSETKLLCLLGNPVAHSKSPLLHNALIKRHNLNLVYLMFRTSNLDEALSGLKAINFLGANITIPYKSEAMKFLDRIDGDGKACGAINTVLNKKGKLYGFNTDVYGIRKSLNVRKRKVLVMGAGGAARAACLALKDNEVVVVNRNYSRACRLEKDFCCRAEPFKNLGAIMKKSDVVVNATPVGMFPHCDASLIPKRLFEKNHVVFDMVYNPVKTKLVRDAESCGARTISGIEMFLHQATKSFEIWTGIMPEIESARKVIV